MVGKHGCGKSYLASLVVNDLEAAKADNGNTAVAYVYCNRREESKTDSTKLLGSILQQLCQQTSRLDPALVKAFKDTASRKHDGPGLHRITELIPSVVSQFRESFLVVDGLDECLDRERISEVLRSFADPTRTNTIKVIVFSRPDYPEFEQAFEGCPQIRVDMGANDDDIRKFISSTVSRNSPVLNRDADLLEFVERVLYSKADGMFLWVSLLVETLKGQRTVGEVLDTVNDLPTGLDEAYELSMRSLLARPNRNERQRALSILLWTTNAKRALSLSEMIEAIAMKPGIVELKERDKISDTSGFPALCGDLVTLKDGYFYLIHTSLKDYLERLPLHQPYSLQEYWLMQAEADRILGEICLTYVHFEKFKDRLSYSALEIENLQQSNPFLQYAICYWGEHVAVAKTEELHNMAVNFLDSASLRDLWMQQVSSLDERDLPYLGTTSRLHVLAYYNLIEIAQCLHAKTELKFEKDSPGLSPLDLALFQKSKEMVIWLLEMYDDGSDEASLGSVSRTSPMHGAAFNDWDDVIELLISLRYNPMFRAGLNTGSTPLHVAATAGSASALHALLKHKVDVNCFSTTGNTPLVDAAENDHQDFILPLIEAGADVNAQQLCRATALHYAADMGNTAMVEMLLLYGARISSWGVDVGFQMPLHLAVQRDSVDVIRLLIKNGAELEAECEGGRTPLHIAAFHNSAAAAKLLISLGAQIDSRGIDGTLPIHIAAEYGSREVLQVLIDSRPDTINSKDNDSNNPLHSASSNGNIDIARMLLDNGALMDEQNSMKHTALCFAILREHEKMAKFLLERGADASITGFIGSSSLHYAALFLNSLIIKPLVEAGADPMSVNDDGDTSFHYAASKGNLEFLNELLVTVSGLDINCKNNYGSTPLKRAANNGHAKVVRRLLDLHAEIVPDADKNLPMHLAVWNGYEDVLEHFLNPENVNLRGFSGRTILQIAAIRGHSNIVKLVLNHGADPDIPDTDGFTPLHAAFHFSYPEIHESLIGAGACLTTVAKNGTTPLFAAAASGNIPITRKLLSEGSDGLAQDLEGATAFLRGVASDDVDIVNIFFESGYNGVDIANNDGWTPILYAANQGNIVLFDRLLEKGASLRSVDRLGLGLIDYAALGGHVEMLDRLLELGLKIEELDPSVMTSAAFRGYLSIIDRILELGGNFKQTVVVSKMSPLLLAAARMKPLIVQKLLEAGADPLERDAYGNNALDYAFFHKPTWQKMGILESKYKPMKKVRRRRFLRQSIRSCLQRVLDHPYPLPATEEEVRVMCVTIIANSLLYLEDASLHEPAQMCFIELCFPPKDMKGSRMFECAICHTSLIRKEVHICKVCFETYLCRACHENYPAGEEDANSVPESLRRLEQLEDSLIPVRQILQVAVAIEGVEPKNLIDAIFSASADLIEWARTKFEDYSTWEKQDNNARTYNAYPKPGLELLKILTNTWKMKDEMEDDTPTATMDKFYLLQNKKLEKYFRQFKHDRELTPFICTGHEYLKVLDNKEVATISQTPFRDDGLLTHDWLRALLDKFKEDDIQDGESETHGSQTPPLCDSNSTNLEGRSIQNAESESESLQIWDKSIICSSKTANATKGSIAETEPGSLLTRDPTILETNETDALESIKQSMQRNPLKFPPNPTTLNVCAAEGYGGTPPSSTPTSLRSRKSELSNKPEDRAEEVLLEQSKPDRGGSPSFFAPGSMSEGELATETETEGIYLEDLIVVFRHQLLDVTGITATL